MAHNFLYDMGVLLNFRSPLACRVGITVCNFPGRDFCFWLFSLATLVSRLVNTVFRIPSWSFFVYYDPAVIIRYGPVWPARSFEYPP